MSFLSQFEEPWDLIPNLDSDLLPYSINDYNSLESSCGPSSINLQHSNAIALANQMTSTRTVGNQVSSCMQEGSHPTTQINYSDANISIGNIPDGSVTSEQRSSDSGYCSELSSLTTSSSALELSGDQLKSLSLKDNTSKTSTSFSCQYCGKAYALQSSLRHNMITHTGEKPYACSTCGRQFTYKSTLDIHNRTHTGEKPYDCSTYGRRFARRSNAITHQRIHHRETMC